MSEEKDHIRMLEKRIKELEQILRKEKENKTIEKVTYIKSSLHYERQKIPVVENQNIDDDISKEIDYIQKEKLKRLSEDFSIKVIGIDITLTENQAIHAIMKILNKKNNSLSQYNVKAKSFKYDGFIPKIEFSPSEYLENFGIKRHKNKEGFDVYSQKGREIAYDALVSLSKKNFYVHYVRTYWIEEKRKKKEKRYDVIRVVTPLIYIKEGWELLTEKEFQALTTDNTSKVSKKRTKLAILPSPLLIDQIDTYFVMKPENYIDELKQCAGKKISNFTVKLCDLFFVEVAQNVKKNYNWIFKRNYLTLAKNLWMDPYIKKRQWKRIRKIITESYEILKKAGYILDYEINIEGKTKKLDIIKLNSEKFYTV